MNAIHIFLLAVLLLMLNGCDKQAPDNKTETAASAVPAVTANELTPEEKFAETKKKAEAGDTEAQYHLAIMYYKGDGITEDTTKGIEWLQKSATQGNASAQHLIGTRHLYGNDGISQDATKAMEWLQKSAAQGNAEAQNQIGLMYELGWGVSKDTGKAMDWYQKSAAQGNASSQNSIGHMYASGDSVPKDAAKAVEWYQKSAAQGDVSAQVNLAGMYRRGEGVPKDALKAVEWYQKAAAQNLPFAFGQFELGSIYFIGDGIPKDEAKAMEWYQKAAALGHVDAQFMLGVMYANGDGVPKDATKSVEWYQKAAAQGYVSAQFQLARMFVLGEGADKDLVRAYAWLNLAAAQGDDKAKKARNRMETFITAAQRTEGQRLASNWKKGDTLQASNDKRAASPDGKPIKHSTGTAFAVSNSGHALTNHHVIEDCTEVRIAGREGVAKVITSDSVNDLALLQLPGKADDIANLNADPGKLRQGEEIVVFGYPLNSLLSSGGNLTPGIISALTGVDNNTNQIQITAPIQSGSSGSPVMDKKGNVVGVVSARLDMKAVRLTGSIPQNVNFAVNGQTVKAFLDANKVPYKTGGGFFSREKSNADIAEEARKSTMLVECWK